MEPSQTLETHLNEARCVYGCINHVTDKRVINRLASIPVTIIIQHEEGIDPSQYQKFTPISLEYLMKMEPNLSCSIKDYEGKAIRSVGNQLIENFLVIEKQYIVCVWHNGTYDDDLEVVLEYRKRFFTYLCLSGELDDKWSPGQYYELVDNDWTLLEDKPAPLPSDSISLSSLPESQGPSYSALLGKALYHGVKFLLEINIGCVRCGRTSHTSISCYARRDIYGRWLR